MNMHTKLTTALLAEKKGLSVIKQTNLKTKSILEVHLTEKDSGIQEALAKDIAALKAKGQKMEIKITVEGAKALGRLINRSEKVMSRLGFIMQPLDWEDEAGEIILLSDDFNGADAPFLTETMFRIVRRATQAIGYTHHPLTIYDLKQTIGLVQDVKEQVDGADDLLGWFTVRELAILEEEKEAKAIAKKAKAAAVKAAKPKVTKEAKPKATGTVKNVKGKAKTAGLADLK